MTDLTSPTANSDFEIAVMAGDGIGIEVMQPTLTILKAAQAMVGGFSLSFVEVEAGAGHFQKTGDALPQVSIDKAREADAILLGAMGLPNIRYEDGREITPQIDLREIFGLYGGVRPAKVLEGVPSPLADPRAKEIDFILIRESTEGLFVGRKKSERIGNEVARDLMEITRSVCERLFTFSFRLAQSRKRQGYPGRLTCVDKANVLGSTAFFREIFDEIGAGFPDIERDYGYVDAIAMNFVKRPWDYDVLVTENMFGDILSDLAAGLIGGLGFAPSADIGDTQAVFQPCHGTAPDIAGQGKANPTAMILSAAMMLDWLGEKHAISACRTAAGLIQASVAEAFADGTLKSFELGGTDGLAKISDTVLMKLSQKSSA